MERDYNMISSRYNKLFTRLDQNFKQQISELDRPTIDFAEREVEKMSNRTKYLTATIPVTQLESLAMSQKIIASNVKFRGMKVIGSMTNFLSNMNEQQRLTEKILLSGSNVENAILAIPVIISEMNFDKFDNKNIDVTVSKVQLNQTIQSAVKNTVNQNIDNLQWQKSEIDKEVKSEFSKMLSDSTSSQRVKDMAHRLFLSTNYQTIKSNAL